MFDTMTMTKIVGGFCGAFLVFLLGGWAAETIYHSGGGHGEGQQAYVIPVEGGEAEVEEGPAFEEIFASADPSAGQGAFRACQSCHNLEDGANATGPHLFGLVGREVGSVAGYNYSGALSEAAEVWAPEELNAFLENPRGYAPGTSMTYSGMRSAQDRANLIAYLATIGG